VSDKLLLQFVDNLNALIASGGASTSAGGDGVASPTPTTATTEAEALDLLDVAGGAILKRLIPVLVVVAAVVGVILVFR
jgi:hypothetical protein